MVLQTALETNAQSRDKEIAELKEKVVSLEAQLQEKTSYSERIEAELSEAKDKIDNLQKHGAKSSTPAASRSTAASVGAKPVIAPEEQLQQQAQPVLFNDPAGNYYSF